MLKFVLVHDGTDLGWQAAYRAFHVAARLGASLLAVVIDSRLNADDLVQAAAEIKVGGNAARIILTTSVIAEFTEEKLVKQVIPGDGLFLPRHLVPDEQTALRFLDRLGNPIWAIATQAEINRMGVFIPEQSTDLQAISYARLMANRMRKPLVGFSNLARSDRADPGVEWVEVRDSSDQAVFDAVDENEIDLLIFLPSQVRLLNSLPINCVIFRAP